MNLHRTPGYDKNPTIMLSPGQSYTDWYARYAKHLDERVPGWYRDDLDRMAGELADEATKRRAAAGYAPDRLGEIVDEMRRGQAAMPELPRIPEHVALTRIRAANITAGSDAAFRDLVRDVLAALDMVRDGGGSQ